MMDIKPEKKVFDITPRRKEKVPRFAFLYRTMSSNVHKTERYKLQWKRELCGDICTSWPTFKSRSKCNSTENTGNKNMKNAWI